MPYYLYAEDFAAALIGPFPGWKEVLEHQRMCRARGDSATMLVLSTEQEVEAFKPRCGIFLTPEQDRHQEAQR